MKRIFERISHAVLTVQNFLENIANASYNFKDSTIIAPPPFVDVEVVTAYGEHFIAYRKILGGTWLIFDPDTENVYAEKPISRYDKWRILM